MIKVRENRNSTLITATVTDFPNSIGYCEHKIAFFIQGIKPQKTQFVIQGYKAHTQEEHFEKEHFKFVPISTIELADMTRDVEFAREDIFTRLLFRPNAGQNNVLLLLYGRTDKIFRSKETLVVQDDKFPTNLQKYQERFEPYIDQKLQALVYLNSKYTENGSFSPDEWFEIQHKEKEWVIQIRDRNNGNKPFKIFKGSQNKEALTFLYGNPVRFTKLVLSMEDPRHHNNPDKCALCGFFDHCQFRLDAVQI